MKYLDFSCNIFEKKELACKFANIESFMTYCTKRRKDIELNYSCSFCKTKFKVNAGRTINLPKWMMIDEQKTNF